MTSHHPPPNKSLHRNRRSGFDLKRAQSLDSVSKVVRISSITVALQLLILHFAARTQSLDLPVLQSAVFNSIDIDNDDAIEVLYENGVRRPGGRDDYYIVGYRIMPQANSHALRSSASIVQFQEETIIGANNPVYDTFGTTILPLNEFSEELLFPNWFYFDLGSDPFFSSQTSLLIGFRADLEDGRHYGWLSFSRPNPEFTTPFTLDSWNWNPVPDLPIKAGLPPEIPLTTEIAEDGSGQPLLRITWPVAVSSWVFQSTTNLVLEVWESYPASTSGVDIPLDDSVEPIRYFRMRQP